MSIQNDENLSISGPLVKWYEENKRQLPWRETADPYLIWISEIILQQTRVAQGLDYFNRFVGRFPDVATLAEAPEDEVLKYWEGLGYYSRARNLHAAAHQIMTVFGGKFPETYEEVLSLKGIGEYTAAAICSFSYGLPHAVVDGNVYRVLSRLFALDTPIDSGAGKKMFFSLADDLLDRHRPGIYNQAIMELGALQCVPRSPRCEMCPLVVKCRAFADGNVESYPVKQGKTEVKPRYFNYLHILKDGDTWINRRSENDIWRNLYELVLIETEKEVSFEELVQMPRYKKLLPSSDEVVVSGIPVCRRHVLSHRIIYARFYTIEIVKESEALSQYKRVSMNEIGQYAFSRLTLSYIDEYRKRSADYTLW